MLMISCSSNHKVVNGQLFQKRKHTKGFYFAGFQKHKKSNEPLKGKKSVSEKNTTQKQSQQLGFKAEEYQNEEGVEIDSLVLEEVAMVEFPQTKHKRIFQRFAEVPGLVEKKSKLRHKSFDEESSDGALQTKAAISFFGSILGWLLLISSIVLLIVTPFNIILSLILLGISLVIEAFAYYFGGDTEDTVKAGSIGHSISVYYWWFMGIILSLFLSIGFTLII